MPWRDVLHEGPVPAGLDLDELREVRAQFIAAQGLGELGVLAGELLERDSALRDFRGHAEVLLWFEHDLYDQLQLLQILDWFATQRLGRTQVCLINPREYLSMLDLARLRQLFASRGKVRVRQFEIARRAWAAFRSADPTELERLLSEDLAPLPYLEAALRRHLEEFPATHTGLSRSERQALEAIRGGAATLAEAFRASHHNREDPVFLGDTVFASYLRRLGTGSEPLVLLEDGSRVTLPRPNEDARRFWARRAVLTEAGTEVLAGRRDWLAFQPIDRWLGGVHLSSGGPIWRWDASQRRLCAASAPR